MRKLLWIGDAVAPSGFARSTHAVLDVLRESWEVHVLGINYLGDPHEYPYKIYPCWPGGDAFGFARLPKLLPKIRPDLIILQNDPWNIPQYMKRIKKTYDSPPPVVGFIAVDGKNCRGEELNELTHAIFWTKFGQNEAILGGLDQPSSVIPLGVDCELYQPGPRRDARVALGLPERALDAFVVGNVNRNQPRKRLDLTLAYFAEWITKYKIHDAYLYLHVAPTGDAGYDVRQYASYLGIDNRLVICEPEVLIGMPESKMPLVYRSFDVLLSTSQGEGMGLTTLEAMACGIPPIVGDWSAHGEWCTDAAVLVPCTTEIATPNNVNSIGGVMDRQATINALDTLYHAPHVRETYGKLALARAREEQFKWPNIGRAFADQIDGMAVPSGT